MLCSSKDLNGMELAATDGDIGHIEDMQFDDARWVIRHLVVRTGSWLAGRRVLIPPHSVASIDMAARRVHVTLTRAQVDAAPGLDSDATVSRQQEIAMYDHYNYPYYWGGSGLWGMMDSPMAGLIAPMPEVVTDAEARRTGVTASADAPAGDPHLRSSAEVIGYDVAGIDGSIGHVHDFLFDTSNWQIGVVVVDTHNWLPDRLVLVPPAWISGIDWAARRASVGVTRHAIESAPPYVHGALQADASAQHLQRQAQQHFEGSQ